MPRLTLEPMVPKHLAIWFPCDDDLSPCFMSDAAAEQKAVSPCAIHNTLASKEEFQQVRQQLTALLAQRAAFTVPFMFESGHLQGSVHRSDVVQAA
ncbi:MULTISPECIES: NHLP-related RiPP peptide [unclassified Stenotrophomonas]|uniref:NHLP-related RiPP peptide n=1 Tax=unclassified Stenotrophomonas TaxID=196198 RepID=UPI000B6361A1|nr:MULTISPECIES: NHLP-related RiPP peptide [unclassified Stenotrophomonas]SNT83746.1 putative modified peptide [Stenotrophomonas sp. CC120222-04]SNY62687.1 putative modified peptide [Stenotrophomonas sp. CC120223-11]